MITNKIFNNKNAFSGIWRTIVINIAVYSLATNVIKITPPAFCVFKTGICSELFET